MLIDVPERRGIIKLLSACAACFSQVLLQLAHCTACEGAQTAALRALARLAVDPDVPMLALQEGSRQARF